MAFVNISNKFIFLQLTKIKEVKQHFGHGQAGIQSFFPSFSGRFWGSSGAWNRAEHLPPQSLMNSQLLSCPQQWQCSRTLLLILESLWSTTALARLPRGRWLTWHWVVPKTPPLPSETPIKAPALQDAECLGRFLFSFCSFSSNVGKNKTLLKMRPSKMSA